MTPPTDTPGLDLAKRRLRREHVKQATKRLAKGRKAMDLAEAIIGKRFGKGAIVRLTGGLVQPIECVATGYQNLDDVLTGEAVKGVSVPGTGRGFPRGRIVEAYGLPAAGKTTFTLAIIRAFQREGLRCVLIDAEHSSDNAYMTKVGVDLDELVIHQPDDAEQAIEVAREFVKAKAADLIVVDSVAALVPQAELEGDMSDSQMALQARLMSKTMRMLAGRSAKANCSILMVNQIRSKVGLFFGNPEVPPGGYALQFYAAIRLEFRRGRVLTHKGHKLGIMPKVKVVKNKLAPPFREIFLEIHAGAGIVAAHSEDSKGKDDE